MTREQPLHCSLSTTLDAVGNCLPKNPVLDEITGGVSFVVVVAAVVVSTASGGGGGGAAIFGLF